MVNVYVALHRNVLEDGLSRPLVLPDSHRHDSVLCVELADVDWDGQEEIVLGTFGKVSKQLCVYSSTQFSTQFSQLNSQLKDILVYKLSMKGIVQTQQHQLTMISIYTGKRCCKIFYFIHKLAVSKKNGFP